MSVCPLKHGMTVRIEGRKNPNGFDVVATSEPSLFALCSRAANGRWPGQGSLAHWHAGAVWTGGLAHDLVGDPASGRAELLRRKDASGADEKPFKPDAFSRGESPFPAFGDSSYKNNQPTASVPPAVTARPLPELDRAALDVLRCILDGMDEVGLAKVLGRPGFDAERAIAAAGQLISELERLHDQVAEDRLLATEDQPAADPLLDPGQTSDDEFMDSLRPTSGASPPPPKKGKRG